MSKKNILKIVVALVVLGAGVTIFNGLKSKQEAALDASHDPSIATTSSTTTSTTAPGANPAPSGAPAAAASGTIQSPAGGAKTGTPDLTVDANGLSKTTAVLQTSQGTIKFKFYTNDAPNTVKRFVELIQQSFYKNMSFHRVVDKFVIQTGDPTGLGSGGSGQKLKAEFNTRRHVEGTVAMARASDPDSADSQFYVCLGAFPHLDRQYTVIGQVTEGMDIARKVKQGDQLLGITLE